MRGKTPAIRARAPARLHSPYPWMNYPESIVQDYLIRKGVPFIWHGFQGDAVNFLALMPGYAPTFTLPDYKIALFVIHPFFGNIPTVLDQAALALTLLQVDGWTSIALYDTDIMSGEIAQVIERQVPALRSPAKLGPEIPNPYGDVAVLAKKRSAKFTAKHRHFRQRFALAGGTHGVGRRSRRRGGATTGASAEERSRLRSDRRRKGRDAGSGGGG